MGLTPNAEQLRFRGVWTTIDVKHALRLAPLPSRVNGPPLDVRINLRLGLLAPSGTKTRNLTIADTLSANSGLEVYMQTIFVDTSLGHFYGGPSVTVLLNHL